MRIVIALARSRASFFTSCNSLRSCCVSSTFAMIFVGDVLVAIEEVQQLLAHVVDQLGADFRVAELVLRLRFEHRVLQANRHRADHAFADVVAFVFALAYSFTALSKPSRKALRCVPPSLVYWPLTKE